jgi:Domain of unknown function (DUF6456)
VTNNDLPKSAIALLAALVQTEHDQRPPRRMRDADADAELLIAADLARRGPSGLVITAAGRARVRREGATDDPFRAQHLSIARRIVATPDGRAEVAVDDAESPLAWLARRKGRDGQPLIEMVQLQAGERLRGDFTRAQMTPRVTSNFDVSAARGRRAGHAGPSGFAEAVVAARERVRGALDAAGPEFAGLLLDVCCFLKGLEDVERERRWPPRSAKVVVQLGLDRLARHYGLAGEARGRNRVPIRTWFDPGSALAVEGS